VDAALAFIFAATATMDMRDAPLAALLVDPAVFPTLAQRALVATVALREQQAVLEPAAA
jgi:hypothetical protein